MTRSRTVTVYQFPTSSAIAEQRSLLGKLRRIESERPRIVLDCSNVVELDRDTVRLLLTCLEHGMKLNGDVKLAALCAEVETALRQTPLARLFEVHPTTAAAIRSFQPGITMPNQMPAFDRFAKAGSAA